MEALRALIEDWLRTHDATQAELSRRSRVPQNVISKWVNGQVDEVSPANLKKIAPIFGLTYEALLRRMGEIPNEPGLEDLDPIERYIRQRTGDFREAVRGTPQSFWATIIDAVFDRAIDTARDMAHLVTIARTEDTTLDGSADTDSAQGDSEGNSRHQRPIKPREPAKFEFAQAV